MGEPELGRFLQDWTALWRQELQAQSRDPEGMAGAMEMWRTAMTVWTDAMGMPSPRPAGSRDRVRTPRAQTAAAASVDGDAEVERLARRIDELEARLAQLEATGRRRG